MWEITKRFDCCYGHRVWNQVLNSEYSLDEGLVCRHLHGHEGAIHVTLQGQTLTRGMVTDFKHLGFFKKFVDDVIDHKFIFDIEDPIIQWEVPVLWSGQGLNFDVLEMKDRRYSILKPEVYKDLPTPLVEKYEGMIFVNFVPTSENLAHWLYEVVDEKMSKIGVKTKSVLFYETPKSRSEYIGI